MIYNKNCENCGNMDFEVKITGDDYEWEIEEYTCKMCGRKWNMETKRILIKKGKDEEEE